MLIRCPPRATSATMRGAPRLLLFACLLGAPAGGCAARDTPMTKPDFETRIALKDPDGQEGREFPAGAVITFVVTIKNQSAAARTLTLPTGQTHEVVVADAGHKEIWRYSRGRMFAQVIVDLTLKPGESRSYTAAWDQTDAKGKALPPGDYEAVGLVPGGAPGCRSESFPFAIRPSASGKPAAP
jgi:hypothetical protein